MGVTDPLEIHYSRTCIIIPNFVALSRTVLGTVGVPKMLGKLWRRSFGKGGMADPLETRFYPTSVTTPNLLTVAKTGWAYVWVPNFGGRTLAPPPWDGYVQYVADP